MGIKYKIHESISSITILEKTITPDKDGVIDVPEDIAAHHEFHRLGTELSKAGKLSLHTPSRRKSASEE